MWVRQAEIWEQRRQSEGRWAGYIDKSCRLEERSSPSDRPLGLSMARLRVTYESIWYRLGKGTHVPFRGVRGERQLRREQEAETNETLTEGNHHP